MIRIWMIAMLSMARMACFAQNGELMKDTVGSNGEAIYRYVEQMPAPLFDPATFLGDNIHYPDSAVKYHIEGRVRVTFCVDEKGRIKEVTVDSSNLYGYGLEEEALRVVRLMPRWRPGRQNGKRIRVYYTLPILFRLDDNDEDGVEKRDR